MLAQQPRNGDEYHPLKSAMTNRGLLYLYLRKERDPIPEGTKSQSLPLHQLWLKPAKEKGEHHKTWSTPKAVSKGHHSKCIKSHWEIQGSQDCCSTHIPNPPEGIYKHNQCNCATVPQSEPRLQRETLEFGEKMSKIVGSKDSLYKRELTIISFKTGSATLTLKKGVWTLPDG